MDTLTRTGVTVPENDGSDSTTAFRLSTRSLGAFLEAGGIVLPSAAIASRPAAGVENRLFKPSDETGVLYWDNGTTWEQVSPPPPTDPAAGTPGLRTLGGGAAQAAGGTHGHSFAPIFAYKTVDTARTSTTTLADDPHLSLAFPTAGTYLVTGDVGVTDASPGSIGTKLVFAYSGTATSGVGPMTYYGYPTTPAVVVSRDFFGATSGFFTAASSVIHMVVPVVVTTAGTLSIQWAQGGSNAGALTFKAGSTLVAVRVA